MQKQDLKSGKYYFVVWRDTDSNRKSIEFVDQEKRTTDVLCLGELFEQLTALHYQDRFRFELKNVQEWAKTHSEDSSWQEVLVARMIKQPHRVLRVRWTSEHVLELEELGTDRIGEFSIGEALEQISGYCTNDKPVYRMSTHQEYFEYLKRREQRLRITNAVKKADRIE